MEPKSAVEVEDRGLGNITLPTKSQLAIYQTTRDPSLRGRRKL